MNKPLQCTGASVFITLPSIVCFLLFLHLLGCLTAPPLFCIGFFTAKHRGLPTCVIGPDDGAGALTVPVQNYCWAAQYVTHRTFLHFKVLLGYVWIYSRLKILDRTRDS